VTGLSLIMSLEDQYRTTIYQVSEGQN